jgi:hypothetical protein
MVEMAEAVMVVQGVVIPAVQAEATPVVPAGAIPVVPVDVVIPVVLPPAVTVGAVHRIVRVVLVHPAVDLPPCPKKK